MSTIFAITYTIALAFSIVHCFHIHTFSRANIDLSLRAMQQEHSERKSSLRFAKYQGLGNDFIIVDNTKVANLLCTAEQAVKICNRNFGVGADGLIFALPGSSGCDYTMRIFNSDGSEPQMCGNGIRCLAKFLAGLENRPCNAETSYRIWTQAGVICPVVNSDGSVVVNMGEPILTPEKVPTNLPPNYKHRTASNDGVDNNAVVDAEIMVFNVGTSNSVTVRTTAVSMGNPHSVVFVDSLDAMNPTFEEIGPVLEGCTVAFPERVNAEFVQVLNKNHVRMKVWERGAGPTLACGTGACAVVVAGVLTGRTERHCTVTLPGGDLNVHWNEQDNRVYMTGPAQLVFTGILELDI